MEFFQPVIKLSKQIWLHDILSNPLNSSMLVLIGLRNFKFTRLSYFRRGKERRLERSRQGGRERRGQGGGQDRREAESRGRQDRARPSLSREGGQANRRIRREEGRGDAGGDRDCIRRPHHSLCCHLLSTFETSQSFPPLPLQSILKHVSTQLANVTGQSYTRT